MLHVRKHLYLSLCLTSICFVTKLPFPSYLTITLCGISGVVDASSIFTWRVTRYYNDKWLLLLINNQVMLQQLHQIDATDHGVLWYLSSLSLQNVYTHACLGSDAQSIPAHKRRYRWKSIFRTLHSQTSHRNLANHSKENLINSTQCVCGLNSLKCPFRTPLRPWGHLS